VLDLVEKSRFFRAQSRVGALRVLRCSPALDPCVFRREVGFRVGSVQLRARFARLSWVAAAVAVIEVYHSRICLLQLLI